MRWPKIDPITRKRFRRFYALKRARYSLYAFLALYVLGMFVKVLCNDLPLVVRYDGSTYFPFLFYYPDDVFTDSGHNTRPDYKRINRSPSFADDSGNWMLFAPVPYGANEGFTSNDIEVEDAVTVTIARKRLIGSVDIDGEFSIQRSVSAAPFFGAEDERAIRDQALLKVAPLSLAFQDAVRKRMANDAELPPITETVEIGSGMQVEASMSSFSPRGRPPTTARVSLREVAGARPTQKIVFHEDGSIDVGSGAIWDRMSEEEKGQISSKVEERRKDRIQPLDFQIGEIYYSAEFAKEDVHFPFRPTRDHWLGLDSSGRDTFARIYYALPISMNFGVLLVVSSMVIGVVAGGLQGYFGGKVDLLGQRAIEIWESLPFLLIMILLGSVYGRSFGLLLTVYAIFNWIGVSYYMRGEFLKLRKQSFIEAAHSLGLSSSKIMFRHILPNSLVPVITLFPFLLVGAISSLSALDYLGFGLPPPTPSWGELLGQAQDYRYAWWLVTYPSIVLFVVVLLGTFIGEGLRAAFDPKINTHYDS